MTVALPLPYKDELLYNVIGRYLDWAGVENPGTAIRAMFGRIVHPNTDLIYGLSEFANQTYVSWQMSAQEILENHTLLPYHVSYATDGLKQFALDVASERRTARPKNFLGLNASKIVYPATFRFCESCAAEDIANGRDAYFRRAHQLPGVFVCVEHQTALVSSSVKLRPDSWNELRDARGAIAYTSSSPISEAVPWVSNHAQLEVAKRSVALLRPAEPGSRVDVSSESYYARAREVGLIKSSGYINKSRVRCEMIALFGDNYLTKVGLPIQAGPVDAWPFRMMRKSRSNYQPLQHILLEYFLGHLEETQDSRPRSPHLYAASQYVCPNRYALHGKGHAIDRVSFRNGPDGGSIASACCVCGLKFTFSRCRPGSLEPDILKVWRFGPDWRNAAKEMKGNGATTAEIGREMDVSANTVKALLRYKELNSRGPSAKEIAKWQCEWEELLASIAPAGHKKASRMNSGLYRMLSMHDKEWLHACALRSVRARKIGTGDRAADWESRDKRWSDELKRAAARVRAITPKLVRASKATIEAEAGVRVLHYSVAPKLPRCQAVLNELQESVEQFQVRRLEFVAQALAKSGKPVAAWKLLHDTGIPKTKLTPVLIATIQRLTDPLT